MSKLTRKADATASSHFTLSPKKPIQKPILKNSRFREFFINLTLVSFGLWCINRGAKTDPFQKLHWTTKIGGHVIFDAQVTPLTPVEMTIWEGDYFTRTQKQVLTNVRSMNQMRQKPLDRDGWLW